MLLAALVGGAYLARYRWLPLFTHRVHDPVAAVKWKPLTAAGAARARASIARLDPFDGPVFANLSAADFASYVLDSAVVGATNGTRHAEAGADTGRIYLRMRVRVAELGADNVPFLGGVADKSVTMVLGGALLVQRPGYGEWLVQRLTVDGVEIPAPVVARVTRAFGERLHRAGTRDASLGFALPPRVADVRVTGDGVTLYKAAR